MRLGGSNRRRQGGGGIGVVAACIDALYAIVRAKESKYAQAVRKRLQ